MSQREGAHGRKLNVLQVCDHLGWEGSRMHGVKRLFAWMIPRFDRERYNVSLVSLRRKDLSEETLDSFGVDITYLHRSKFDPATLPDLLKVITSYQSQFTIAAVTCKLARLPLALYPECTSQFIENASARWAIFIIPVIPPLITTSPRR